MDQKKLLPSQLPNKTIVKNLILIIVQVLKVTHKELAATTCFVNIGKLQLVVLAWGVIPVNVTTVGLVVQMIQVNV